MRRRQCERGIIRASYSVLCGKRTLNIEGYLHNDAVIHNTVGAYRAVYEGRQPPQQLQLYTVQKCGSIYDYYYCCIILLYCCTTGLYTVVSFEKVAPIFDSRYLHRIKRASIKQHIFSKHLGQIIPRPPLPAMLALSLQRRYHIELSKSVLGGGGGGYQGILRGDTMELLTVGLTSRGTPHNSRMACDMLTFPSRRNHGPRNASKAPITFAYMHRAPNSTKTRLPYSWSIIDQHRSTAVQPYNG